jgi:putative component of toxin-antitoxin plasmid stabilization module
MDQANKIVGLLVFFGAATVTAMILAFFAHDGLGVRLYVIRDDALVSALLCSGMLGIALVSKRRDKRK